jgi:hypothetical protein
VKSPEGVSEKLLNEKPNDGFMVAWPNAKEVTSKKAETK